MKVFSSAHHILHAPQWYVADGTVRPWLTFGRHIQILRSLWEHRPSEMVPTHGPSVSDQRAHTWPLSTPALISGSSGEDGRFSPPLVG